MRKNSVFTLALVASSAALGQDPAPPVPVPPSEKVLAGGRSPSVTYLMQAHGLSESEARERIELQNEAVELAKRLEQEGDPAFSGVWLEQEPAFRVVVAFADRQER